MPNLTKRVNALSLALVTVLSTSCATVQPYDSVASALKANPGVIYLTKTDSSKLTLASPMVKGDSLSGFSIERNGRYYRYIALTDVARVSAEQPNEGVIVGLVVVVGGLVALVIALGRACMFNCGAAR